MRVYDRVLCEIKMHRWEKCKIIGYRFSSINIARYKKIRIKINKMKKINDDYDEDDDDVLEFIIIKTTMLCVVYI